MPAPTPYIIIHNRAGLIVTQVGLVAEASTNPILLHECTCRAVLQRDRLEDKYGDLFAEAWGNRSLSYDLEMDQLAQYGVSDHYLGRIDATLLANLTNNFGMGPDSGTCLMTAGERTRAAGHLPSVRLTIEIEDTRNSGLGSPDGASTPAWGGTPGGTKPTITNGSTETGAVGNVLSITLTATGTTPITWSLAEGTTLPDGLTLVGAVISGTPTGAASETYLEVIASNAYGTHSKTIRLSIAAAAVAPPDTVQVYVRYIWDSADATIPDGFWVNGFYGMSPAPTNETSFYTATPTTTTTPTGSPALPTHPTARTGTEGGHDWEISEILGWNGTEYEYWYRKSSSDTALLDAINAGQDPVTSANEESQTTYDIGTDGPGNEADPSWPGTILPDDDRITQYFVHKNYITSEVFVTGLGGDKTCANVDILLSRYRNLSLNYTETKSLVLMEFYDVDTTAYLYQKSSSDTLIADSLAATESPIWYAGTAQGSYTTSLPFVPPTFVPVATPTPPGTYTGPAISAETWFYALERLWLGGGYQVIGYRNNSPPILPILEDVCRVLSRPTSDLTNGHTETTAGKGVLVEVWALDGANWKAIWLDATLSAATSLLGPCIADGISPVNNALTAPGYLYTVSNTLFLE